MGLLQKLWQRLQNHDRWLVASVSLVSGILMVRAMVHNRRGGAIKDTTLLPEEKAKALAATLGLNPRFSQRLVELAVFKARVGHADVPLESASGSELVPKGLGKWVYSQRKRKADGKLQAAEEAALTSLGFRWKLDPDEMDVSEMIERLVAYKGQFGDTLVPKKYESDPLLGAWVAAIRRKADPLLNGGESILDVELKERLDRVCFSWEPAKRCGSNFMTGFRIWSEAKSNGMPVPDEKWCELQREARRQGKLSEQRIAYLDKFGFEWNSGERT